MSEAEGPTPRRWEPRYTREDLTLANAFTTLRLLLIPVFGVLWSRGDDDLALWIFAAAAFTDVVDGFLARFLNQKSRLGALLDPIADKLLMLVALLVGVKRKVIPLWLCASVLARDGVLLLGALGFGLLLRGRHDPAAWRPTRVGKYAMFLQSSSIVGSIVDQAVSPRGLHPYLQVIMIATAGMTVVAGTQYSVRALQALARGRRG